MVSGDAQAGQGQERGEMAASQRSRYAPLRVFVSADGLANIEPAGSQSLPLWYMDVACQSRVAWCIEARSRLRRRSGGLRMRTSGRSTTACGFTTAPSQTQRCRHPGDRHYQGSFLCICMWVSPNVWASKYRSLVPILGTYIRYPGCPSGILLACNARFEKS